MTIYMIGYKDDFMSGAFVPVYNTLDKTEAFTTAPRVKEIFKDAEDHDNWYIVEYPIKKTLINTSWGWMSYIIEKI